MNATLGDLAACLDRYGSDSADWPSGSRASLQRLARESRHARAMIEAARTIERALDTLQPPAPSPALASRVAGCFSVPGRAASVSRQRLPGRIPVIASSTAAALVVVLVLSLADESPPITAGALASVEEDLLQEVGLTAFGPLNTTAEDEADEDDAFGPIRVTAVTHGDFDGVTALDLLPLD